MAIDTAVAVVVEKFSVISADDVESCFTNKDIRPCKCIKCRRNDNGKEHKKTH